MLLEAPPPTKGPHPGGQKSQGSTSGSLVWLVRDSQRVLPPGGSGLVPDGHHRGTLSPHVPVQSWPIEEALGVTTSHGSHFLTWLRAVSEFSLINLQYGPKASFLHLPPIVNDCLTRHPCRWKFANRNSLSVPTWHSGGTMAVNRGAPVLAKEDRATGRYLSKPSQVYRGTQSAVAVNWSGGHSTRRPSSWRRCRGSLGHLDGEVNVLVIQNDDPSYFLWFRIRERLILIALSLFMGPILWGLLFTGLQLGDYPTVVRWAGCTWLSRGPAVTPQALIHLEGYRLSRYSWPLELTNIADEAR